MYHALDTPSFLAIGLLIITAGCRQEARPAAAHDVRLPPEAPNDPLRLRVTGHDFRWIIRYPGPDRVLDTLDDFTTQRHLHLPERTEIQMELCSDDFVYSLYLPDYDRVEIAFPGRPFLVEFSAGPAGTSKLLGAQMCGFTHEQLIGDLVVLEPADFRRSTKTPAAP